MRVTQHDPTAPQPDLADAWARVDTDCGCPDLYYCPRSGDIECLRHSGFTTCCTDTPAHILARPRGL